MAPSADAARPPAVLDHGARAERLLALTRDMLRLAETGDWVLLAERENERQNLSAELFATPVPRESAPVVAECIRRLLDLDQDLLTLVQSHRDEAAQAVRDTRPGRAATDAYRRFSR